MWNIIAISALIVAAGSLLFLRGIARADAGQAAVACYVEPVITIMLSVALLGEGLTALQGIGAALILAAIGLVHLEEPEAVAHRKQIPAVYDPEVWDQDIEDSRLLHTD